MLRTAPFHYPSRRASSVPVLRDFIGAVGQPLNPGAPYLASEMWAIAQSAIPSPHPSQTLVILSEADHSIIVIRAVEGPRRSQYHPNPSTLSPDNLTDSQDPSGHKTYDRVPLTRSLKCGTIAQSAIPWLLNFSATKQRNPEHATKNTA
jgi:hypothetical protein